MSTDEPTNKDSNTTTSKEQNKDTNKEKKKSSTFKTGDYTSFTGVYGVFQGFGNVSNLRCVSRHESVNTANKIATQLFESYTKDKNTDRKDVDCIEIMRDDPYWAFATVGWGSNTLWVEVRELEIEKCQLSDLKKIAQRENIDISDNKSKKKLLETLLPTIQHKKHLNRYKDIDFENCELCKVNNPNEYQQFKEERDKNPLVIKSKLITNMYRKKLFNPIKKREVKKTYGFNDDELEKAILDQQIHFQRKSCFGNHYILYERSEVIKYYEKMQKSKKEESEAKKRKMEVLDFTNLANEPVMKRRKLGNCNDEESTDNIDYKGVPEWLRGYKWLYLDCNELSDDGRKKIIQYFNLVYRRDDIESEDVLLKRIESIDGDVKVVKDSVFRMCFKTKKWKKVKVSKKIRIAKKT